MLLYELFENQAARQPYAVALTDGSDRRQVTYGELNELANRFAHLLIDRGVGAETCVGLHLPPGVELIAAMLGTMKSGGAYVPLDPDLPAGRLAQIIECARPGVIVSSRSLASLVPDHAARLLLVDSPSLQISRCDNPDVAVALDDLCYVMFTSGSTGAPKGVMVTHGNLEPLFDDIGARLDIRADDVWTAIHPCSFGFSVWEIWGALRHGGRLVIVPPDLRMDPTRLFELVREQQVTIISQTPSAFRQNLLSDVFKDGVASTALRFIVLSGEEIDTAALGRWFAGRQDDAPGIVNTYAVTETSGQLTFASYDEKNLAGSSVGEPLAHAELAVVDKDSQPVPIGRAGELLVGGPCVARGYIGEPGLTNERFIEAAIDGYRSTRWYRTGDRSRLNPDGTLEFLGRSDDQVKLRGFRVEPGEIAAVLREHPAIDDAVVIMRADNDGPQRLVGYIVPGNRRRAARPEFWPSVGPYQLYDEFLYDLMSSEAERLASYREAFDQSVLDKVVLDIGTGEHALLARMCIDAGARRVYAVEVLADACDKARALVHEQGLDDRIVVIHGDIASIDLPEHVDVCTQGIVGNIGSADGIVPIWNGARRYFAADCIPVPVRCRSMIAAVELPEELAANPAFGPLAASYVQQAFDKFGRRFDIRLCVSDLPERAIVSDSHLFEELDFTAELAGESAGRAALTIDRDARLDGYLVWTVVETGGKTDVDYRRTQRAWLPVFFPLGETGDAFGVPVRAGQTIDIDWSVTAPSGIHPDYRVSTSIASGGEHRDTYEYRSCYAETRLNATPLHRAIWSAAAGLPTEQWRHWLAERLPEYMVPSAWVELERLPLTSNHKLDRKALPAPEAPRRAGDALDNARDDLESDLVSLWREILSVDEVGIHENFFDLGGDSISAVRMTSALQRLLDDPVMLVALFDAPTVAGLGQYLREHHEIAVTERYSAGTQVAVGIESGAAKDDRDAPLSFQQQSFWVLNRLYPAMTGSNEQFVIPLSGAADVDLLERAWNAVLERHEILRTVFRETDAGVRQVVLAHDNVSLPVVEMLEAKSEEQRDRRFVSAAEAAISASYDLANGPLINACLFRESPRYSKLLINAHHIIADGLSIRIIRDELASLYDLFGSGHADRIPAPAMQYRDYSIRQRAESHGDGWERSLDFWRGTLQDAPDRAALPLRCREAEIDDRSRGHQRRVGFVIDAATADAVRALSRRSNTTLFMTLLAAFRVLLTRYTGQDEILIGSPVTSRDTAATRDMIGCLVNNVVFRNPVIDDRTFADVLQGERSAALASLQHAGVPFESVVEALHPRRRFGEHPLFQILFLFEDAYERTRSGGELTFGLETLNTSRSSYWDIEFSVSDFGDDGMIRGYVGYSTTRFDDSFAESLPAHYASVLRDIVADPRTRVGNIALLGPDQRREMLVDWNALRFDWPGPDTLHQRFSEQVELTPDSIAIRDEASALSYRELSARVDQLAGRLRDRGIGPGDLVGIGAGRSIALVTGIIATLKIGAAYVPLDPNYPPLRLQFIVAETDLRMILTDGRLPRSVSGTLDTICLDEEPVASSGSFMPEPVGEGADAAYVLFTSGSTGAPKGAIGLHGGAVNRCEWMWREYGFTADDIFCLRTSPNFVDSVWEIFGPLMHGATLRVIADADVTDPARLIDRLAERQDGKAVSHIVVVPSLLSALLDIDARLGRRLPDLHTWITSGEPLRPELLRRFRRACPGAGLLNTYGTSEIWDATCFDTSSWDEDETVVPIGKPIANVRTHILDALLQPVPVGVVGELYVGGIGLGGGYLNNPELNAERFIPDPFSTVVDQADRTSQLYRTGDLARYRADGNIECLGRADRQIKLRGFRIEPDEIAAALRDHPGVSDAYVVLQRRNGDVSMLVGYWQSVDGGFPDDGIGSAEALRAFLRARLPEFMLPGSLLEVDAIPLTPSGKVDVRALADCVAANGGLMSRDGSNAVGQCEQVPFVAPGTETERAVAGIWCEILGVDRVGLHDDFFDCGGHSLSATRLLARIRSRFDISPDLAQFFDAPTLVGVARHIDELRSTAANSFAARTPASAATGLGQWERGDRLPLSFAQERLWFLNELDPDSPAYNIAFTVHLSGNLDVGTLQSAVDLLVRRHESLRTRFLSVDGRPYQEVLAEQSVVIRVEDLHGREARDWERRLAELSVESFALDRGPLLRLHVLQGDPNEFLLLVVVHHIVSDGLSNGIFFDELATLYECVASGCEPALPDLPIQYADYSLWQRHGIEQHELDSQLDYWIEQLRDAPPALELPTDRARPAEQMFRGAWLWRELSGERVETLRSFGRRNRCTLFMVLLGTFDVLLSRYSGQTDIVVGSPIAGRSWTELDGMIGLFVNTVALRTDLTGDPTVAELLARVRRVTLDSQANQDLPFERLVDSLRPDRTLSHAPVFQVMFNMTPIPDRTRTAAGVRMRIGRLQDHGVSTFDLTLNVGERAGGLDLVFEYDRDLFDRRTVDRIATHFDYLLRMIVDATDVPVSALPLWSPDQSAALLETLNPPLPHVHGDRPGTHPTVIESFEHWAVRQPDAVAVEYDSGDDHSELTYGELDRKANQLAAQLREFGIEPGAFVAVCLDRSVDLLVAVLGVLKAGCAYVPLDSTYPATRLADMFAVVQPGALVTNTKSASVLSFVTVPTIVLDEDRVTLSRLDPSRHDYRPHPADTAYALFTSGSTGTPKAVAVTHDNLAAICRAWIQSYALVPDDRHLQMASFSFDVFTGDWVRSLCSGARLILCPRFDLLEPRRLYALLRDARITVAEFVPAVLRGLLGHLDESGADLSFMRLIAVGSDTWHASEYAALAAAAGPHVRVINSYGTAETTIDSTYFEFDGAAGERGLPDGPVPIGRPFAGTRVYVCDSELRLVPPGVAGELCIGGSGVAAGYIGEPQLSAERFVQDPHVPDGMLYRTGDSARYRSDGTVVLLGRLDRQVKLRGFRIELGDIEAALSRQTSVAAAAVIVDPGEHGNDNSRQLVAYLVCKRKPIDIDVLRVALRGTLPDYMVPSLFIEVEELPLTPNGKVDRRRLPPPENGSSSSVRVAPGLSRGPLESVLLELFGDLLGIRDIGVHDSFFDRGGHSLLATQLISRIRDVLDIELPLRSLFEDPTISGLITTIARQAGTAQPPLRPMQRDALGAAPISLTQQRLWFLAALEPDSPAYHLHWSVRLNGALDRSALSRAVDALVSRHEVLRTTFGAPDGVPRQYIAAHGTASVEHVEFGVESVTDAHVARRLGDLIVEPFDLATGPLFRVHVFATGLDQHCLTLVMHHIISDGWSMSVLFEELSQAYNAYRRGQAPGWPALPIQYADFAVWQRERMTDVELTRQAEYWRDCLEDAPVLMELPTDRPRPAIQNHSGAWIRRTLSVELSASLQAIGRAEGCTLFMVLAAAFDFALARYIGTVDVVIGTPIAGRTRTELEGLIGFFVNTLVLRTSVDGNPTFREMLARVKRTALDAFAHQDLPFEKLVEVIGPRRSRSYNPIVQVLFTVHNQPVNPFTPDGLTVESIDINNDASKFDLSVHVAEHEGRLELGFGYNAELFEADSIDGFAHFFESILDTVSRDAEIRLSAVGETLEPKNGTDWTGNLVERFLAQVQRTPGNIAVRTPDRELSFDALNESANLVAQRLLSESSSTGAGLMAPRVGLLGTYDSGLVVGMLGILKAGCAWVPLDPAWPAARLDTVARDAGLTAVVTDRGHQKFARRLTDNPLPIVLVDEPHETDGRVVEPDIEISSDSLACIIYTSGSTGVPKGVAQTHGGVVIQVGRYSEALQLSATDRLSGLSDYAFDAAIQDIFGALLNGAAICPSPVLDGRGRLAESMSVVERLAADSLTVIHATPSLFRYLFDAGLAGSVDLSDVRVVVLGGEVARRSDFELFRECFDRGTRFVNGLGLTESTVALHFIADHDTRLRGDFVPVGNPVAGLGVDLVDESGAPSWCGEIVLTGSGLSPGYWPNIMLGGSDASSSVLHTGDIARRLPDGQIAFVGRRDGQVNVRGYRIELREIEAALGRLPGVADAAARIWLRDGDTGLVAYAVAESGADLRPAGLRDALAERLPRYMLPQTIEVLDALPRLPNGKVARDRLPAPRGARAPFGTAPRTELERELLSIWADMLQLGPDRQELSVHDEFFAVGGHSLMATRVIARIRDQLNVEVPLASIFDAPTVAGLAAVIESLRQGDAMPILKSVPRETRRRS